MAWAGCMAFVSLRFDYHEASVPAKARPSASTAIMGEFWNTSRLSLESEFLRDLAGAVAFLHSAIDPELPVSLIGYSFGCSLLA